MARPVDPDTQYRIKLHVTHGYAYASTQSPHIDPTTGKKKYQHVHWGSVVPVHGQDEKLKFIPGSKFYLASPEERKRLIFPEDWDMSEVEKVAGIRKAGRPACPDECQTRLYGDVWLLDQIASQIGIRQDLEVAFNGNQEIVDDILTLAIFPYLTEFNYSRVARWQRAVWTPSSRELTPPTITRLIQSITKQNRMDLLRLRAARVAKDGLCAVDSTSSSAYGDGFLDIYWDKNKELLPLQQTTDVVVYSLSSHMPAYYKTFSGNMPSSQEIGVILTDLEHAGFKDLVLITDRGYDTLHNLEKYILRGQSMVMCAKTGQRDVAKVILEFGEFSAIPEGMMFDSTFQIWHKQYDLEYAVKSTGKSIKASNQLKLNLYFDPIRRGHELVKLETTLSFQKDALVELLKNKETLGDDATITRDYPYYNVVYDPATRVIESFALNGEKVAEKHRLSGFLAIMTYGVDFDAMRTFRTYLLRDEQEKYFQQMKSQMGANREHTWSEEGKDGWLIILFVSLILSSYVHHIWESTNLHDLFSSSLDILDEMRSVRIIEHTNRAKEITPFVGAQMDICEAFGIQT